MNPPAINRTIRAVLVDDEKGARMHLTERLAAHPGIEKSLGLNHTSRTATARHPYPGERSRYRAGAQQRWAWSSRPCRRKAWLVIDEAATNKTENKLPRRSRSPFVKICAIGG